MFENDNLNTLPDIINGDYYNKEYRICVVTVYTRDSNMWMGKTEETEERRKESKKDNELNKTTKVRVRM